MKLNGISFSASHHYIHDLLKLKGPMTDEEIWDRGARRRPDMSQRGARFRRYELCKMGLVEDSGDRRETRSGMKATVWRVRDEHTTKDPEDAQVEAQ